MAALWDRVLTAVSHFLIIGPHPMCPKMSDATCRKLIFARVFHGKGEVSDASCSRLIQFGMKCHDEHVEFCLMSGGYGANTTTVLKNNDDVWNGRVSSAHSPAASPLVSCKRMKNAKCGHEIVRRVFRLEGRVTRRCCWELMKLGREYHDELVEARIVGGGYDTNATPVLSETTNVWKQCQLEGFIG